MTIRVVEAAPAPGSIAATWDWLINIPYLGWLLGAFAAALFTSFVIYAVAEIQAGRRSR